MRCARIALFTIMANAASLIAGAQERPTAVVEALAGWVGFADDAVVDETVIGGAARWYLSPRIAVGPELLHISGERHSHFIATGNLTWDILSPAARVPRAVTPFLVAGGGMFQSTYQFLVAPSFTSREGAFTAGGGVRGRAGERVTVGVDARIGWELHLRINGLVGVRLGR